MHRTANGGQSWFKRPSLLPSTDMATSNGLSLYNADKRIPSVIQISECFPHRVPTGAESSRLVRHVSQTAMPRNDATNRGQYVSFSIRIQSIGFNCTLACPRSATVKADCKLTRGVGVGYACASE